MTGRADLERIVNTGDHAKCAEALRDFIAGEDKSTTYDFAAKHTCQAADRLQLKPWKLAFLSSFTLETVTKPLIVTEFLHGRSPETKFWPYNQWQVNLLETGALDAFEPDAVFLCLHLEDVAPRLSLEHLVDEDLVDEEVEGFLGDLAQALTHFRSRNQAPVFILNFVAKKRGFERCFDWNAPRGRQTRIDYLNAKMSELCQSIRSCFIIDYVALVADHGRQNWFDAVKWHLAGMAITHRMLPVFAAEISRHLTALCRSRKKVMAVDLDNTIWGGILGEDGIEGISVGGDYPGNAFSEFQSALVNLKASGVLLAAVSKNNESEVREAFMAHPGMPLEWNDFAARRIDWNDKVVNLTAIAQDINVGIDSLVFADDSPLETNLVQEFQPEVLGVHLDGPPSLFADMIVETGAFDTLVLTEIDRERATLYQTEGKRRAFAEEHGDMDDFFSRLDLRLNISLVSSPKLPRVTQLFARTNQFNMTTRRYSQNNLADIGQNDNARLVSFDLSDRYGSYGIIGAAILLFEGAGKDCHIDSFLMSCRALGRKVEDAMLACLERFARKHSAPRLIGHFVKTRKNAVAECFYADHGFVRTQGNGPFERDLQETDFMTGPLFIKIEKDELNNG